MAEFYTVKMCVVTQVTVFKQIPNSSRISLKMLKPRINFLINLSVFLEFLALSVFFFLERRLSLVVSKLSQ